VLEAGDGDEALRLLSEERPDVAILDVVMPGASGLAVCRAVRSDPDLAETGVVMLSANATAAQAADVGADRFLVKPFLSSDLLAAIRDVANGRGTDTSLERSRRQSHAPGASSRVGVGPGTRHFTRCNAGLRSAPGYTWATVFAYIAPTRRMMSPGRGIMARILVVDDEPTIRRLLRVALGPNHQIGEAANGAEALRSLLAEPWDIVILDVAMSVMDGLTACRAARAEPSHARLGVIVVSAFAIAEDALAAGADRRLQKPFRPLELLATINDMMLLRAQARGGGGALVDDAPPEQLRRA
jgi:CheY-like chemotaxis protein